MPSTLSLAESLAEDVPAVAASPLNLDRRQRSALAHSASRFVDAFLEGLDDRPASFPPVEQGLIDRLLCPPADGPSEIEPLLETVRSAIETGVDTAAGTHLSFIPNGGLYSSSLARFLAAAVNRYTGASFLQPGAVALEQGVIRWMCELFSLGPDATGVLLSGGSMATFTATVAARTAMGDRFDDARVYTTDRTHHSVTKACRLAGIPERNVCMVGTDERLRMKPGDLARAISRDERRGLRPMMIVATAGTTDTGAIDPFDEIADVAGASGAWLHIDAAYGGFFVLTERGSRRLAGVERADSITVDPHKSLMLPYGVGGLLVADGTKLIEANLGQGSYLQDMVDNPDLPHFHALGPELTRPYRGLDVWLPLHLHGVGAFRAELDRMLDLAETAAAELAAIPGIVVVAEPSLSIVAFRSEAGDAASAAMLDYLNRSKEVHVSSTTIDGTYALRIAFLNHRTTSAIADRAVALVAEAQACINSGRPLEQSDRSTAA